VKKKVLLGPTYKLSKDNVRTLAEITPEDQPNYASGPQLKKVARNERYSSIGSIDSLATVNRTIDNLNQDRYGRNSAL
jgi:hypothetical protein